MPDECTDEPDRPLRIDVHRTGGFGGVQVRVSLALDTLSDEQVGELLALLGEVDLDAAADAAAPTARPDAYGYDITVTYPDRQQHVVTNDAAASPELRALLARVLELGR